MQDLQFKIRVQDIMQDLARRLIFTIYMNACDAIGYTATVPAVPNDILESSLALSSASSFASILVHEFQLWLPRPK